MKIYLSVIMFIIALELSSDANALIINSFARNSNLSYSNTSNSSNVSSYVGNDRFSRGYADSNADSSGRLTNSAAWTGIGFDNGYYATTASYQETYNNNSNRDITYSFDFNYIDNYELFGDQNSCVFSRSIAQVLLNGTEIYRSMYSVSFDDKLNLPVSNNNIQFNVNDNSLRDSVGDFTTLDVKLSGYYSNNIQLGTFAPGEAFTLQYIISSYVAGMECGTIEIASNLFGEVYSDAIPAPEPSTLFLLGIGLGGLVTCRIKAGRN